MKKYILILLSIIILISFICIEPIYLKDNYNNYDNLSDLDKEVNNQKIDYISYMKRILNLLITIYTIIIGVIIFLKDSNSEKTISWLLILLIFPIGGLVLYHFLGQNIRKKKIFKKKENISFKNLEVLADIQIKAVKESEIFIKQEEYIRKKLINLLLNNSKAPVTVNNCSKILTNGNAKFKELKKDLKKAKNHIHLEYYIIKNDVIGNEIKDILIRKAKEGVLVRLIYDSVGSFNFSKKVLKEFKNAGVKVEGFLPVFLPSLSREINYRNHRKIIVIDGNVGYIGGINIGDEYLGKDKKFGFWRDTHLKIEGEGVYGLQNIFIHDWYFCSKERLGGERYFPKLKYYGNELIQIIPSGPDTEWEAVLQSYFSLINYAKERVWITTPYLVPDESVKMALKTAALSGIDVRIIIPNIPDHKVVSWSTRSNIEELLRAGVKIYRYKKGFIHCKNLLVDNIVASIGTANLDYRSFLIDFEANALVYSKKIANDLEKDFLDDFKHSEKIIYDEWINRPIIEKIQESIGRLLSPLL